MLCKDDFDEEQWLTLCLARVRYVHGTDRGGWYRVLRGLCNYRAGSAVKEDMECVVDRWLIQHPSWVQHMEKRGVT